MVMCSVIGGPPPAMTMTATGSLVSTSTTHTHSGLAFGAEDATRYLVAAVAAVITVNTSSVTIGGVSASLIARTSPSGGACCELWGASVPTGTSGSVVIVTPSNMASSVVDVYRLTDLISTTPTATSTDTASTVDTSVSVLEGGFVIAAVCINDTTNTGAPSWSGGVTQVSNTLADQGGSNGCRLTTARYDATSDTTVTPSLSVSLAAGATGATASFR